jgi:hypothetical protein
MENLVAGEWITGRESGRRLGVSPRAMPRLAEQWNIRRRVLKGVWTMYYAPDVATVASRAKIIGTGVSDDGPNHAKAG